MEFFHASSISKNHNMKCSLRPKHENERLSEAISSYPKLDLTQLDTKALNFPIYRKIQREKWMANVHKINKYIRKI